METTRRKVNFSATEFTPVSDLSLNDLDQWKDDVTSILIQDGAEFLPHMATGVPAQKHLRCSVQPLVAENNNAVIIIIIQQDAPFS